MDYATQSQRRTYALNDLGAPTVNSPVKPEDYKKYDHGKKKGMNIWLIFIVLAIIIGFILYFSHPSIVLSRNAQTNELYVDWGKLILWAIGIAIIVVLLLWVLKGIIGYELTY